MSIRLRYFLSSRISEGKGVLGDLMKRTTPLVTLLDWDNRRTDIYPALSDVLAARANYYYAQLTDLHLRGRDISTRPCESQSSAMT